MLIKKLSEKFIIAKNYNVKILQKIKFKLNN